MPNDRPWPHCESHRNGLRIGLVLACWIVQAWATGAAEWKLTATSSDQTVVADENLRIVESEGQKFVEVTPSPNGGVAVLTVAWTDGSQVVPLSVTTGNTAPGVSPIAVQTVSQDTELIVDFRVEDMQTPPSSLVYSVLSSNPDLLPESSIHFSGTGTDRILRATPAQGRFGTATVFLTVSDGEDSTRVVFEIIVSEVVEVDPFEPGSANDSNSNPDPEAESEGEPETSTAQSAPRIDSIRIRDDRAAVLSFSGEMDAGYRVEMSSDLAEWSLMETVTGTGIKNVLNVVDEEAGSVDKRFYRIVRTISG